MAFSLAVLVLAASFRTSTASRQSGGKSSASNSSIVFLFSFSASTPRERSQPVSAETCEHAVISQPVASAMRLSSAPLVSSMIFSIDCTSSMSIRAPRSFIRSVISQTRCSYSDSGTSFSRSARSVATS